MPLQPGVLRAATTALIAAVIAVPAAAQVNYPNIRIGGRLHQQFYFFDNSPYAAQVGPESNFFVRRARIEASGHITKDVSFVIQPSFEGGRTTGVRLRDAYIDLALGDPDNAALTLRVGQEKRPFSRFELLSSNVIPTMERGAGRGLLPVATNNLFDRNGFLAHDVGASLIASSDLGRSGSVTVQFGVYNGQGESLSDVNGAKSYGARVDFGLTRELSIGGAFFRHDQILDTGAEPDSAFYNDAWEVDGQWGRPGDPGLFLLAEHLRGEATDAARTPIAGTTFVGAWHFPTGRRGWVQGFEPALRIDVADPDLDTDDDRATLISGIMGIYFSQRAKLRIGYEHQSFQNEALESIGGIRTVLGVSF